MKPLLYLFLLLSVCGYGQVIATYNFERIPVLPGSQDSTSPSTVASGWTASYIKRGSGIVGNSGNNTINSRNFGTSFDANDYYEFTFTTPSTGGPYNLASFALLMRRSPSGPQTLDIRYSINGASETSVSLVTLATPAKDTLVNFPAQGGLTLNQTLRIRIYGYAVSSGTLGTLSILGSNTISLPVTYLYFNTKVVKDKVAIEFATTSEENNDFFQIERSRDGISFDAFDRLASNAGRGGEPVYKLVDNTPYAGINYYRIKQVDTDGKFSYSKVSAVDFNAKIDFIILNNRTYDVIEINSSKESYDLELYNTSGQLMKNLKGLSANQTISLSDFNDGAYILRLIAGNEVVTERVVKM
jgi:hypothetical protein